MLVMVCNGVSKISSGKILRMSPYGGKTAKILVLVGDSTSDSAFITCSMTYRPSYDTRTSTIDYQCLSVLYYL